MDEILQCLVVDVGLKTILTNVIRNELKDVEKSYHVVLKTYFVVVNIG